MKSKVIILCLIFVILLTSIVFATYKPSIHTASLEQLSEIEGIGQVLSDRVCSYLLNNPQCDIEDLVEVRGIGEIKLSNIKEVFK